MRQRYSWLGFPIGIALASIMLNASPTQAQGLFRPGYLVLQRGDTVRGLVEPPTRSTVAYGVNFKPAEGRDEKLFYPIKTLRGAGLTGGKTYVVRNMLPVMRRDTLRLLLEPLVQGRANLYRSLYNVHTNNPDEVYANQFSLVYYYVDKTPNQGRLPFLLDAAGFRQNLTRLFADCQAIPAVKGKFNETTLIQLMQQYNACPKPPAR